jgi:hypothetical protein
MIFAEHVNIVKQILRNLSKWRRKKDELTNNLFTTWLLFGCWRERQRQEEKITCMEERKEIKEYYDFLCKGDVTCTCGRVFCRKIKN